MDSIIRTIQTTIIGISIIGISLIIAIGIVKRGGIIGKGGG